MSLSKVKFEKLSQRFIDKRGDVILINGEEIDYHKRERVIAVVIQINTGNHFFLTVILHFQIK